MQVGDKPSERKGMCFIHQIIILGLSFLSGTLFLIAQFSSFSLKPNHYWSLSDEILKSGTLGFRNVPSTAFEPAYPILLAFARWMASDNVFWILIFQVCLHAVTAIVFYKMCHRMSEDNRVALIAGTLYSLYPYYVRQSCAIIDFPLLMLCLMTGLYFYLRAERSPYAVLSGIFFGLAILTRFVAAPVLFLACAHSFWRKKTATAFILFLSASVVMSPYLIRNHRIDGSWSPTRVGFNLFRSNNERAMEVFPKFSADTLDSYASYKLKGDKPDIGRIYLPYTMGRDVDHYFYTQAWDFVKSRPLDFLKLKALNLFYVFYPQLTPLYPYAKIINVDSFVQGSIPNVDNFTRRRLSGEIGYSLFYTFIFIGFLWGVYIRRKVLAAEAILWIIVMNFLVEAVIFSAYTRHKAPMDFVLMYYAAHALSLLTSLKGFSVFANRKPHTISGVR